ncbi:MAG TPA: PilZ domain-containing protein [Nitrospira sp.]|nr:PilZ domain-containing protein [Nitrospira sp.]
MRRHVDPHDQGLTARPLRRLARVPREFLCEVAVRGLSVEGRTVDLNERGLAVMLPHPLFAHLDSVTVILTRLDGALVRMSGRVIRQRQIGIGEVLVGIQLADLPAEATNALVEKCAPASPLQSERMPVSYPAPKNFLDWLRLLAGFPSAPFQDRRRIPRLPIHTACTILNDEKPNQRGLTQDVSYTGLSAWFSDLSLDRLWGAVLQVKFVKLKVMPIGITHRGSDTLVRFRVEHIYEGEERWRDVHHTYWQHLS